VPTGRPIPRRGRFHVVSAEPPGPRRAIAYAPQQAVAIVPLSSAPPASVLLRQNDPLFPQSRLAQRQRLPPVLLHNRSWQISKGAEPSPNLCSDPARTAEDSVRV